MENELNVLSHIMSQMKSLALKDIASLVQICFYIIGATIAILTYRSAKRGLLNTINTEYQKRVIDHLEELSETLYAEFYPDPDSRSYNQYYLNYSVKPVTIDIIKRYKEHIKGGNDSKEFISTYFPLPPGVIKIDKFRQKIKSDPFIPDHIAKYVVNYMDARYQVTREAVIEELLQLYKSLKNQEYKNYKEIPDLVDKNITERIKGSLYTMRTTKEVHKIRKMIKDYLKSFNPLT